MDLPLLLCGPILRRVEPTLVAVWVAVREPATVTIKLWEGRVTAGAGNVFLSSDPGTATVRVGAKLHIAVATLKIPVTSPRVLQPNRLYSYDVSIATSSGTSTLNSLGLLSSGQVFGRELVPLGYQDSYLPSFALPPADITRLRVLFGSCRRVACGHIDSMPWIDDLMADGAAYSFTDPLQRPHQMFLGGDQIYADDVFPVHLHFLMDLGKELIGTGAGGGPIERVTVDNIRRKVTPAPTAFNHYGPSEKRTATNADDFRLPADHTWLPAGRRFLLTTVDGQMTTVDGWAHLFSLGEFAAMYLTVWSETCWPRTNGSTVPALALPTDEQLMPDTPVWPDPIPTYLDVPLGFREARDSDLHGKARLLSPFQNYGAFLDPPKEDDRKTPEQLEADYEKHVAKLKDALEKQRDQLRLFESGLAKVRRVLANIPTYMMFDDHEVTDDWNLNLMWYDRVYSTSLGVITIRNALVSYALFQDWGNDPRKYERIGIHRQLLEAIPGLFPAGETKGPVTSVANTIDLMFGFNLRGTVHDADGSVSWVNPPVTWHFSVAGPKHLAVALDNRTRRSFVSVNGPPGNVAGSFDDTITTPQTEQVPAGPFTDGKEVLFVIAPLQVFGPPILDELVAPAVFRVFDAKDYEKKLNPGLRFGSRGMMGTNPDAIEAWAFDPKALETLLRRLAPYRRVVLLSGDVHYTASTVMSYWLKGTPDPARFVQFTSSGFKNVMPSYITVVDRSMSLAHKIVRARIGAERLGWIVKPQNPVLLPSDATQADVPRALRARLRLEPMMIPTYGWPQGSVVNPAQMPDWSWRVEPIFDLRADAARPAPIRALALDPDVENMLTEPLAPRALDGYEAAAARHQRAVETLRNSRQILFRSNFGIVRFELRAGVLHAIHEIYTAAKLPEDVGTAPLQPELFVLHEASLAAPEQLRPETQALQPIGTEEPRQTTAQP